MSKVSDQLAKARNLLDPGPAGDPEWCNVCGCLFIITEDGENYLWVDRYIPANDALDGHDEDCECHHLGHATNDGSLTILP